MLKDIRIHLANDDQQGQLDRQLAEHINHTQRDNAMWFNRIIPTLNELVQKPQLQNISLFCNKYGQHNMVDYGLGRTFYGPDPAAEIAAQVTYFQQHCRPIDLSGKQNTQTNEQDSLTQHLALPPLPQDIECLVVLGCGLGKHLLPLIEQHNINNLIVYEPQRQYFQCSTMVTSWKDIFVAAEHKQTSLFLQIDKDGLGLAEDIKELQQHTGIESFYLYQHYHLPAFEFIQQQLKTRSWLDISEHGLHFSEHQDYHQYLPPWTAPVDLDTLKTLGPNERFERNMEAFKRYFPDIHKQFTDYKPRHWQPMASKHDAVNLLHGNSLSTWYGDNPRDEAQLSYQNFNQHPNKDGLVLGYKGTKHAHYVHYQFVRESEAILEKTHEEVGKLPEDIASIILFGIGCGYQLEALTQQHNIEHMFICEPNPDFFYASLFAIDWAEIFDQVERSEARIYINIGDDGTNLFNDLLGQFYAIGPYILNKTYFYQCYYNEALNRAISQLREQLQIVISMGEYFDHAYYGIAHTRQNIERGAYWLRNIKRRPLTYAQADVPVILVGNGPSLDGAIDTLLELQHDAIIVSCGTSLKVLHKHGIRPDFHAEIEQNRATYDWATVINDYEFLKQITLLSCNGVHPDTMELYGETYLAFKEGESSTVSATSVLGEKDFEILKHAYPTVSNFALDLFLSMGFHQIYLFGVDLGFKDVNHHHSKSSAYYDDDDNSVYDFARTANAALVVPGNFQATVHTKHEFKVAKQVMEHRLTKLTREQGVYNCSDGAKIQGALPLPLDDILIMPGDKATSLQQIRSNHFDQLDPVDFAKRFDGRYSTELLSADLTKLSELLAERCADKTEADRLIQQQKEIIFDSYRDGRSLLFYYLYGSMNYANSLLVKLLYSSTETGVETFNQGLELWRGYFATMQEMILWHGVAYDISRSPHDINSKFEFAIRCKFANTNITVISTDASLASAMTSITERIDIDASVTLLAAPDALHNHDPLLMIDCREIPISQIDWPSFSVQSTIVVLVKSWHPSLRKLARSMDNLIFVINANDEGHISQWQWIGDSYCAANALLVAAIEAPNYHVLIAKYFYLNPGAPQRTLDQINASFSDQDDIFVGYKQIAVNLDNHRLGDGLFQSGDRGIHIGAIAPADLVINYTDAPKYEYRIKLLGEIIAGFCEQYDC